MVQDPFGWVGHTVGEKLRVEAVVAEGGFGIVYRARHLGFDERVALKCLKLPARLEGEDREKFLAAFMAEGKLLHRLSRSNVGIVQALDVGAAMSPSGVWTPYLALEWLEGETLEDEMTRSGREGAAKRSLPEVITLLESAARALAAAHEQGVAHRDIKPANLFVTEVGGRRIVKVVDFGIAKVMSDVTTTTRALAETGASINAFTPQYGAPEQFDRHFGATGPWTDVFAFGLVVVELLAGRSALDGGDTMQLFIAATNAKRRPTPRTLGLDVSDAVEQILARALAVEPRERYATAGAFWDALVEAATGVKAPSAAISASAARAAGAHPHASTELAAPSSSAPTRPVRKSGTELAEPLASAITSPDEEKPTVVKSAVIPVAPARAEAARSKSGLGLAAAAIVAVSLAGYLTVRAARTPDMATESTDPAAQKIPWPSATESARPTTTASTGTGTGTGTGTNASAGASAPAATRAPDSSAGTVGGELAPEDRGFVDKRGGWGWGDRCWLHIKANRLAAAKAACDKGMEMDPASPQPRASLLYNEGLVEQKRGNDAAARTYYEQSLALRPNAEVAAALKSLDTR